MNTVYTLTVSRKGRLFGLITGVEILINGRFAEKPSNRETRIFHLAAEEIQLQLRVLSFASLPRYTSLPVCITPGRS